MPEPLVFYAWPRGGAVPGAGPALPAGLVLERFRPRPWRLRAFSHGRLPLYLYWYAASRGAYEIWYLREADGRLAHYAHVLPRLPSFPFMGARDLEIGPCWTDPARRGQGLYPLVLAAVAAARAGEGCLWVICEAGNRPSRRGIEKAGFRLVGRGRRRLGRYLLEERLADTAGPG